MPINRNHHANLPTPPLWLQLQLARKVRQAQPQFNGRSLTFLRLRNAFPCIQLQAGVTRRLSRVAAWVAEQPGWRVAGVVDSPILGPQGNREFLLYARRLC